MPSSFSFENGRLFGPPETRSCLPSSACAGVRAHSNTSTTTSHPARSVGLVIGSFVHHRRGPVEGMAQGRSFQLEDVDHTALRGVLVEPILVRKADGAERRVWIVGR